MKRYPPFYGFTDTGERCHRVFDMAHKEWAWCGARLTRLTKSGNPEGLVCQNCVRARRLGGKRDREAQRRRMQVNPEPLVFKAIPVCRDCGMRAPWCKCGSMNYTKVDA